MEHTFSLNDFEAAFERTEIMATASMQSNSLLFNFFTKYGGATYDFGLYRVHNFSSSNQWNRIIGKIFPEYLNKVCCFGFDWYGRHYAIDIQNDNVIYMFDGATFEEFRLESTIEDFHNKILVQTKFDTFLVDEYEKWKTLNPNPILFEECIGFKVPLFLGGKEEIENLELQNMKFYWEINHKLYNG